MIEDKFLSDKFLIELFKLCFRKREVIEICNNYIKFHYLPSESYKKIWKTIKESYINSDSGKIPTIGIVSQIYTNDSGVQSILAEIKEVDLPDVDTILVGFEEFIKRSMFVEMYDKLPDLYNHDKKKEAYELVKNVSEEIVNFSIKKNSTYYDQIFSGFINRHKERRLKKYYKEDFKIKIPFGIDELDDRTLGGIDVKDSVLWIMRSGVGKTKVLRHHGVHASRLGFNVLHIQAEGSKEECMNGYDATWTACLLNDVKYGSINNEVYKKLKKTVDSMVSKGCDVYIHAFEQFGSASMMDVRNLIIDFEKCYGKIDLLLIDYLEKLEPGDGKHYFTDTMGEKMRREATASRMKNICLEFDLRLITATQATDVPPSDYNDPGFVMTRHNISLAKGLIDVFSYVITGNQTSDEYNDGIMRLYIDKFRNYKGGMTIPIVQNYRNDRFYDRKKTLFMFYLEERKQRVLQEVYG